MKVTIIGAGSVALANACYLSRHGHEVHLWSAIGEEVEHIAAAGAVTGEGFLSGPAAVVATGDLGGAVKESDAVIIAAPGFAHRSLMAALAPHVEPGQPVIVEPVVGLSSLVLSRMLKDRGVTAPIVDVSTSIFTARKTGRTSVHLFGMKSKLHIASLPASSGEETLKLLNRLFGERFNLESNALIISLGNQNPVYHVPPFLCNLSRIEKGEQFIFWDGMTPGVARFVQLVDDERIALAERFGISSVSTLNYFKESYGVEGNVLAEVFANIGRVLKGPVAPTDFEHRFILEDVPYALVFFHSLGGMAGVRMPITESLITITAAVWGHDFVCEGQTMEALGLDGRDVQGVLDVATNGF